MTDCYVLCGVLMQADNLVEPAFGTDAPLYGKIQADPALALMLAGAAEASGIDTGGAGEAAADLYARAAAGVVDTADAAEAAAELCARLAALTAEADAATEAADAQQLESAPEQPAISTLPSEQVCIVALDKASSCTRSYS